MNLILLILFLIIVQAILFIFKKKSIYIWLPDYLYKSIKYRKISMLNEPTHIMFCLVDHFEPGTGRVSMEREEKRVNAWIEKYPILADRHYDADGKVPQHTWFFPPHYNRQNHLVGLVELYKRGYGEIEMHLHHSYDSEESLKTKIEKCIQDYSKLGIFGLENNKNKFAFIHGDWSLDNSRGEKFCGVKNELKILKDLGCYADFTFPCGNEAQPAKVNTFYYAFGNHNKSKSYNYGVDVCLSKTESDGLMIIQGPIGIRWKSRKHKFYPSIETSNICNTDPPTKERIDFWVKTGIHIEGKPNWIFIKVHCHGAIEKDWDALLGSKADQMYSYLETKYNDGRNYILHYVTARELYNIVRAAEYGKEGNPNSYRNFLIKCAQL